MSNDPTPRQKLIRLAAALPQGDGNRRKLLGALNKRSASYDRYMRYSWEQYVKAMGQEYLGVVAEAVGKELGYAGGKATPNSGNTPGRVLFTLKDDHGILVLQGWPNGKNLDVNVKVDWQGKRVEAALKMKGGDPPNDFVGKVLMKKIHLAFKKVGVDWPSRKSTR